MRRAAALLIAALVVTSVHAAEVTPAAQATEECATLAVPTAAMKPAEAKGRMPVRGMSHFAAVYARNLASTDDSTAHAHADASDQAAALAHAGGSRG